MSGRCIMKYNLPRMKNSNCPKDWKNQSIRKDRNYQKQGKEIYFQGRKVQEKLPDIKKENLVKEGAISTLD